jgi:iron-sulfur cluster repair protein YtfE (RIC family)
VNTHTTTAEPVDTSDMIVVHTALLREIRLAPAAISRADGADARRRGRTARHVALLLDLLEHHHHGEDELLLPLLRERVPRSAVAALDTGEEQHARIEELIATARERLERWSGGRSDATPGLTATLTALHGELEPHLRGEERDVLPLAATYLSPAEWHAIGDAGARSTPKSALVGVFGMFMYEGDPVAVRAMLAQVPAVPRMLLPHLAPRAYARLCRRVHGTARP